MSEGLPLSNADCGRITSGIAPRTLAERTLEFVRGQLPTWRDDPSRPVEEAEERLNAQLCKFLNSVSRQSFPMVCYHHEEKQTDTRRIDFSALPSEGLVIGTAYHTIYEPFIVFEGKRLPAPARAREREYVTGGELKSGGIQRFKLGLHGARYEVAGMIGYIQKDTAEVWHERINTWIREASASTNSGEEIWSADEQLLELTVDAARNIAHSRSSHTRSGQVISPKIDLGHLWVRM